MLVHGGGGTARLWHRQVGAFARRFRVLAPDLPGFGGTDDFPEIADVRGYGGFLRDFLAERGVQRAFVVGSSMGGWAACRLALDSPEMLGALVLVSPAGLFREERQPIPVSELLDELRRYYEKSRLAPGFRAEQDEEMEKAVATILRMDGGGGFAPDIEERLGDIRARTMIIWGRDDRIIPAAYAEIFHGKIPGSKLVVMEGAGHLPFAEKPEEFGEIVMGFLGDMS